MNRVRLIIDPTSIYYAVQGNFLVLQQHIPSIVCILAFHKKKFRIFLEINFVRTYQTCLYTVPGCISDLHFVYSAFVVSKHRQTEGKKTYFQEKIRKSRWSYECARFEQ